MRNIFKVIIVLFFCALVFGVSKTFAAEEEGQPKKTQRWACLDVFHCNEDPSQCSGKYWPGHTAKLTPKSGADERAAANSTTFLVECIYTDTERYCNTGNPLTYQELEDAGATADLATLQQTIGVGLSYSFTGVFSADGLTSFETKYKSSSDGGFPSGSGGAFEWVDYTPGNYERSFYTLNLLDPDQAVAGNQGGQQLGTLDFATAEKTCVKIRWDPYGRLFDTQTLEPLLNVKVDLYKKRDLLPTPTPDGVLDTFTFLDPSEVIGFIENPYTTREDGGYAFVVEDGTYQLKLLRNGLNIEDNLSNINPNYSKMYSDIYKTDAEIVQKGAPVHRDIPVASAGAFISPTVKLMSYSVDSISIAGRLVLDGTVSHPFTRVRAYSKVPSSPDITPTDNIVETVEGDYRKYRLLKDETTGLDFIKADKDGNFKMTVSQLGFEIPNGETFGFVTFEKVDLTGPLGENTPQFLQKIFAFFNNLINKGAYAETPVTTVKFDPIPSYLEGFVYDATGKVIPNALVGLYIKNAKNPWYQTTADSKGYFKISSEYIPFMPYTIKYITPSGETIQTTTSSFLAQNANYLEQNEIVPYSYTDKNGVVSKASISGARTSTNAPLISSAPLKPGQGVEGDTTQSSNVNNLSPTAAPATSTSNSMILIAVVLLLLLGVVGIMLAIYVYKKNAATNNPY